MADLQNYPVLSVCATIASKLSSLPIVDGQLIFVQDKHRIAFDYNSKRVFYNQIEEIDTEMTRQSMLTPVVGRFYFVIDSAVLWTYRSDGWKPITTPPEEIVFIGAQLPELGSHKTLYVDTNSHHIAVWKEDAAVYDIVADKTNEIGSEDINALFT